MLLLDDATERKLVSSIALGATAPLVARFAIPRLQPALQSVARSALVLFVEAEFEAEEALIAQLVKTTVEALVDTVQQTERPEDAQHLASNIVSKFEKTARQRSHRQGWHERDAAARYRHHIAHLKRAVAHAAYDLPKDQQACLAEAAATVAEDWRSLVVGTVKNL